MRIIASDPGYIPPYASDQDAYLTQGVDPHGPYPTGLVRSSYWRLFTGDREIVVYDTPVTRGGPQSFAILPKGTRDIRAEYHRPIHKATVSPLRFGILPEISENQIHLTLGDVCHALIETNGTIGHPLALFTEDASTSPDPDDPDVLWFEPGLHRIHTLSLRSGQTLYFAPGAIVVPEQPDRSDPVWDPSDWAGKTCYQDLITAKGQKNIRICGSGILDTTSLDWHARRTVVLESCENVEVSGITMVGAAHWTMPFFGCRNIHVDRIRMLGYRENSDGIDLVDSHHALVENCFIRTGDDAICLKSMALTPQVETYDILVRGCCVWNDKVRAFGVAGETRYDVYQAVFEHCDVIHSFADWTTCVCALGVYICDAAQVHDITFRDIRIQQESNHAVCCCIVKDKWSTDDSAGQIYDIRFENIQFPQDFTVALLGYDDSHRLRDVHFSGCTAGENRTPVDVLSHVELEQFTEEIRENTYPLATEEIRIRDPFVVTDREKQRYYLFGTTDPMPWKGPGEGFLVYESRDLKNWSYPKPAFTPPANFWATTQFWAPEVHFYRGAWYMLASFNSPHRHRGVQILRADQVTGPYVPIGDGPVTPADWECLDGTLFLDEAGQPWLVFSHEWTQIHDGAFCCARLSQNLTRLESEPTVMFHGSQAPWTVAGTGDMVQSQGDNYVTDGPWLYRSRDGHLRMLWSSYCENGYSIGIAESTTGQVTGSWVQQQTPLLDIGGHGMLFKTLNGQTYLALHTPNTDLLERATWIPFEE